MERGPRLLKGLDYLLSQPLDVPPRLGAQDDEVVGEDGEGADVQQDDVRSLPLRGNLDSLMGNLAGTQL
jgi:hypothetical protein